MGNHHPQRISIENKVDQPTIVPNLTLLGVKEKQNFEGDSFTENVKKKVNDNCKTEVLKTTEIDGSISLIQKTIKNSTLFNIISKNVQERLENEYAIFNKNEDENKVSDGNSETSFGKTEGKNCDLSDKISNLPIGDFLEGNNMVDENIINAKLLTEFQETNLEEAWNKNYQCPCSVMDPTSKVDDCFTIQSEEIRKVCMNKKDLAASNNWLDYTMASLEGDMLSDFKQAMSDVNQNNDQRKMSNTLQSLLMTYKFPTKRKPIYVRNYILTKNV